jgi:hypothetical protein
VRAGGGRGQQQQQDPACPTSGPTGDVRAHNDKFTLSPSTIRDTGAIARMGFPPACHVRWPLSCSCAACAGVGASGNLGHRPGWDSRRGRGYPPGVIRYSLFKKYPGIDGDGA